MLYCILMTGVFLDRAPSVVPAVVSTTCLVWISKSYHTFLYRFRWEARTPSLKKGQSDRPCPSWR